MTIEFNCHVCGKLLRTADEKAGRTASCPGCGEKLTVPGELGGADDEYGDDGAIYDDDDDDFESSYAAPAPRRRRSRRSGSQNTLAMISMITGITGLVIIVPGFCCGCFYLMSIPLDIAAVVTGGIALYQIGQAGGEGKSQALTGVICGAVALIGFVVLLVIGVAMGLQQPQQFNF